MFFSYEPLDLVARAAFLSFLALVWVIFVVRLIGLRAFSKMTAFDFVVTIATGSLLAGASQATRWSEFFQPALAIAALLAVQYAAARLRKVSTAFNALIQNTPTLLMHDGLMIEEALRETRVSGRDVMAKLREANVREIGQVRAVVLEATGDISVLHGPALEERLIEDVRRVG